MSIPHAAGALYSTVLDLLKWDRALDSEKLLPRKSIEAMFTPFKDRLRLRLGHRQEVRPAPALTRRRHPGFRHDHRAVPAEKLLVVVLSNLEGSRVGTIGDDLAAIALGGAVRDPARAQACPGRRGNLGDLRRSVLWPTRRRARRSC